MWSVVKKTEDIQLNIIYSKENDKMSTFYKQEPDNIWHLSLWNDQNRHLLTDLLIGPTKRFCSIWLDDENKPLVCCRIDQNLYELFLF